MPYIFWKLKFEKGMDIVETIYNVKLWWEVLFLVVVGSHGKPGWPSGI